MVLKDHRETLVALGHQACQVQLAPLGPRDQLVTPELQVRQVSREIGEVMVPLAHQEVQDFEVIKDLQG